MNPGWKPVGFTHSWWRCKGLQVGFAPGKLDVTTKTYLKHCFGSFLSHVNWIQRTSQQQCLQAERWRKYSSSMFTESLLFFHKQTAWENITRDVVKPIGTTVLTSEMGYSSATSAEHVCAVPAAFPSFHTWVINLNLRRKWKLETPVKDSTKI